LSFLRARKAVASPDPLLAMIDRTQAVIRFKTDGTIITANDNFLKVLGYDLSEIVGRHHSMFVVPAQAQSAD
jgi:methyl-accepting chemotaxis protein